MGGRISAPRPMVWEGSAVARVLTYVVEVV